MNNLAVHDRKAILVERQLRDRISELEEELLQAKLLLVPTVMLPAEWRLEPAQHKLIIALFKAPGGYLSHETLFAIINKYSTESDPKVLVAQQVLRARRKLRSHGIEIIVRWGAGYELSKASLPVIKAAVDRSIFA